MIRKTLRAVSNRIGQDVAAAQVSNSAKRVDTDLVLGLLLRNESLQEMNDPVAFCNGLRQCIEPMTCRVQPIKNAATQGSSDKVFLAFQELLSAAVPAVPVPIAIGFARIADKYRGTHQMVEKADRAADVSRHFVIASSSGRKGRLVSALVNHFVPRLVLELGTAYGISSYFIASAMKSFPELALRKVVTVEAFEPQATLSRTLLTHHFGDLIQCEFGLAKAVLPRISQAIEGVDFYFHDAGHTYDDYVHDVGAVIGKMRPSSILMLDDINWEDTKAGRPSHTKDGWHEIVKHERVRAAFEIDGEIGVAMFA